MRLFFKRICKREKEFRAEIAFLGDFLPILRGFAENFDFREGQFFYFNPLESRKDKDFFLVYTHMLTFPYFQDEERELLQPDLNSKDVRVINDLIEDLTRLETREKIPLSRLNNNNNRDRTGRTQPLTKQTSLVSGSSRGSGPESVIIETHNDKVSDERVSSQEIFFKVSTKLNINVTIVRLSTL